jgi:alpha-L-glutamate ligase-like protein/uncharacterized protein (TIGR02421 family)
MFPLSALFRNHGVLGMNARNLLFIKPFNPKKAVAFADDKLKTKAFLAARGIPVAKIYARIETREQLYNFDFSQLPEEFVLKPNYGFGGEGILIIKGRKRDTFLEQGKNPISGKKLVEHIEDILDGKFSVNGLPDTAFFEKILVPDTAFAPFRPVGLPDIRIVVFNLVPVMAMLRVPTAESKGKANVHQGGIGIGIDIAKGVTTHAVQRGHLIYELPHGGSPAGIEIPQWEEMLLYAARIQAITNIGYLAVDLTLDAEQGPVLLEVNARAGLMVQVANLAALRVRLERVQGIPVSSPEKGVRIAQDLFGEKTRAGAPEEIAPGRSILGTRETIEVVGRGVTIEVPCLIAPEQDRTVFTADLLAELVEKGAAEIADREERTYRVKFTLDGKKVQTLVREGEVQKRSVRAIIGKRDLAGFLIDPMKESKSPLVGVTVKRDLRVTDKLLAQADQELLLLRHLKPLNLSEERERAERDERYNPFLSYAKPRADLAEFEKKLKELSLDESPLGALLEKKRRELLMRIALIQARGDAQRFTEASEALFGNPGALLVSQATTFLESREACDLPVPDDERLTAEEAAPYMEAALKKYGLHDWQVVVRLSLVADCTVGGTRIYLRQGALFAREHIESLIAHEIETHALTQVNGESQPYELFRRGFANYLDTQEGMAVLNQDRVLSPHSEKRYGPARSVLAVSFALQHSFAETRRYLVEELGYRRDKAITKAIELKRGLHDTSSQGGFTKSLVYFRGALAVRRYLEQGGEFRRLYIGKVALETLDLAEQVPGIRPPVLLPTFLTKKKA